MTRKGRIKARGIPSIIRNSIPWKAGPNFGGHFTLVEIGCGSSCIFAFLIDARNGRVVDFPLGARTTISSR